ncbi:MAG TPA: FAD-dependent thymidylate synthase [Bacteroidota bacterium]|jgi:thymidylate synthase (FAD)|nr:FAD-dependent thymidylate synthase [Bacteroidota bacterium]
MAHVTNPRAEELLDKEFKCLNAGFVRLIDYMGGDESIVQAARVSYGKGTKTVNEDRGLIRYLLRHMHTTPFEMVELKFHVKLPIFVARQWIRHRTANVNEYSGRYSVMKDEFYVPEHEAIHFQSLKNKQGRRQEEVPVELREKVLEILSSSQDKLYGEYEKMLEEDIARELARINLPLSLYTEWYWKIDLHNLFHFLRLRMDAHAQYEIRVYGEAMGEITKSVAPMAWEAFEDYVLKSEKFSRLELSVIAEHLQTECITKENLESRGFGKREAEEFLEKLRDLEERSPINKENQG